MTAAVLSPLPNESSMLVLNNNNVTKDSDDLSIPSLSDDFMMEEDDNDDVVMDSTTATTTSTATMASPSTPSGLVNLGNTCYMNAALQSLMGVEPLLSKLESETPPRDDVLRRAFCSLVHSIKQSSTAVDPSDFKRIMDEQTSLFVGYRQQDSHEFLTTLLDLLHEEYQEEEEEETMEEGGGETMEVEESCCAEEKTLEEEVSVDIPPLTRSLTQLEVNDIGNLLHGAANNSTSHSAIHTSQQDDEEPQYKLVGGRSICTGSWTEQVQESKQEERSKASTQQQQPCAAAATPCVTTSPVDDVFTTSVSTRITCDSCKHSRTHTETYRALSLEISESGGSIQDSLRKFFAPQQLQVKCEHCFCETATQAFEITRAPHALILHLKRFLVNVSSDWTSVTYRKNSAEVDFYKELNVQEFLALQASGNRQQYKLSSVVNHIGSSASCGHYTADALRRGEEEWMRFNDGMVTRIDAQQATVQSKRTAYMVVYELQ